MHSAKKVSDLHTPKRFFFLSSVLQNTIKAFKGFTQSWPVNAQTTPKIGCPRPGMPSHLSVPHLSSSFNLKSTTAFTLGGG